MNPEVARIAEALRRVGLISERTVLNDYLSVALARLDLPLLAAALYDAGLRLPEPPATGLDETDERLDFVDELLDSEHETAAFLHRLLWGDTPHDTEPGDGSDCHECYEQAHRLRNAIVDAYNADRFGAPK